MSLRPASRFDEVYRTGVRSRHGAVTLIEAEGRSDLPEIGFVAGRRVGSAVVRNTAKRRMREAAARASFRGGRAYVLIASPEVAQRPFPALLADVRAAAGASASRTSGSGRDDVSRRSDRTETAPDHREEVSS